ncbi:major facilitator superfamily domain-containing protein [Coniochaeta sp. 2T2.1]|nr:major facilitator superfamily domain-containing protein [Coniochaeta sp. 2T2.1]
MTSKGEEHGSHALEDRTQVPAAIVDHDSETVTPPLPSAEAQARERLDKLEKDYGATWSSPHDPSDPYNWPSRLKVSIGVIFSFGQLVTLMSASMIAAALSDICRDLDIEPSEGQIVFSTYFLGLAFGPFLVAAWAEMSGRKGVWLFANAWFILWNALCPVGRSKGLMIVGRLMTGLGASAGVTLTGPVMADMYREADRGKSLAIASFLPYLGPALGPILGGLLTHSVDWPWVFWIMCIFDAAITVLGLVFIRESYTPVLLRHKAAAQKKLDRTTTTAPVVVLSPRTWWSYWRDFFAKLGDNMARPVLLLVRRPIVQIIALLLALNFGIYTFLLSTFATLYIDRYGQTESAASLHYIAIAVGSSLSSQVGGRIMDVIYRRLADRALDRIGRPEFRVPWMAPGVVLLPVGLFWYGWSAERGVSWAVVDVGAAVFSLGCFISSQSLLAYQLDEFAEFGASSTAATKMLSYVLGFAFPVFAPQLYEGLGYGWGNSLLGFVWIVVAFPLTGLLWILGERLRGLGREERVSVDEQ